MNLYLTDHLAPITGRIRVEPEDFAVEELPLYEPAGTGTHTWLQIEKRGLSTFEVIRRIARALRRHERDIGFAGLKDRHAVAIQWLSIEHLPDAELAALSLSSVKVLATARHPASPTTTTST
jgi:tRNA pseudouridine13 synthase